MSGLVLFITNYDTQAFHSQTSLSSSFGTLMTATLEWEGIPAYIIGIARGISATIGIAATLVYPIIQSRISTLRTGLWSIWSQVCSNVIVAFR